MNNNIFEELASPRAILISTGFLINGHYAIYLIYVRIGTNEYVRVSNKLCNGNIKTIHEPDYRRMRTIEAILARLLTGPARQFKRAVANHF